MFTKRILETAALFVVNVGPCAKAMFGAGIESQVFPPSFVLAMVRQGLPVQYEMPNTKPTSGETKVEDSGSKPDGKGVPAGAVMGGLVVVVEDVVGEDVEEDEVVELGGALFFEELRLKPIAAATMITTATTIDAIASVFFLVMAFLHRSPKFIPASPLLILRTQQRRLHVSNEGLMDISGL